MKLLKKNCKLSSFQRAVKTAILIAYYLPLTTASIARSFSIMRRFFYFFPRGLQFLGGAHSLIGENQRLSKLSYTGNQTRAIMMNCKHAYHYITDYDIKTWNRSIKREERLSVLAMLRIHRNIDIL